MPIDQFRNDHPISWALATVAEHAELLIHLEDDQRRQLYAQLGLAEDVIDLIENPSDENRETLQGRVNKEWPEDPGVIYFGVVKGVVK
jgi:hypothetical protein